MLQQVAGCPDLWGSYEKGSNFYFYNKEHKRFYIYDHRGEPMLVSVQHVDIGCEGEIRLQMRFIGGDADGHYQEALSSLLKLATDHINAPINVASQVQIPIIKGVWPYSSRRPVLEIIIPAYQLSENFSQKTSQHGLREDSAIEPLTLLEL